MLAASRNCPCDNVCEVLSAKIYHVDQPYNVDIHPATDQRLHFDINTNITPYEIHYTRHTYVLDVGKLSK